MSSPSNRATAMNARGASLSDAQLALWVTVLFVVLGTFNLWHHEMWRDEMQAWLLARDSANPVELLQRMRYEGHPALWHLLLMPLTRVTQHPVAMQVLNLAIISAAVYTFARWSPFTAFQRVCFAFGYFCSYEYAVLSREYSLGVLLLCIFCVQFPRRYASFAGISVTLAVLAQTSVTALVIAFGCACGLFVEYLIVRRRAPLDADVRRARVLTGGAVLAIGFLLAAAQIVPANDSGLAGLVDAAPVSHVGSGISFNLQYDPAALGALIRGVGRALFPFPQPGLHFWGKNWIETIPHAGTFIGAFACVLLALYGLTLLRRPAAFVAYTVGSIALASMFYLEHFGSVRHFGHFVLLLVFAMWMSRDCVETSGSAVIRKFDAPVFRAAGAALTGILVVQLVGGAIAMGMDQRYVFSQGRAAAEYIRTSGLESLQTVAETDYAASTVVGYLGTRSFYYPRGDRWGSFVIWDKARLAAVSDERVVQKARDLAGTSNRVLLVMSHELPPLIVSQYHLNKLASFTGATIGDEVFHLYILRGGAT